MITKIKDVSIAIYETLKLQFLNNAIINKTLGSLPSGIGDLSRF